MAENLLKNEMASMSLRHRAVCEDDSYRGRWRKNIDEAYEDARKHRAKPGNENHFIRIITEQTVSMRFLG